MSGGGGGSRGKGCPATGISAAARNMVQNLKEIVNLPDQEIYAVLKECAMDPSEAVQRLLSQDTFHEVKRKRDKKKEMKDFPDSRTTTVNNTTSVHGVFGDSDRVALVSSIQSTSTGSGESHGGPVHKRENGMLAVTSLSNVEYGSDHSRTSAVICETASIEKPVQATGIADGSSLHSQTLSGYQHGWAGKPHVSLADIVKMGMPQDKLSRASIGARNSWYAPQNQITSNFSQHGFKQSGNPVLPSELDWGVRSFKSSHEEVVIGYEQGTSSNQSIPYDDWSSVDNLSTATNASIIETSGAATSYVAPSQSAVDVVIQFLEDSQDAEIPRLEQNANYESLPEQTLRSASVYDTPILVGDNEGSSSVDDGSLDSIMRAYQFEKHAFEWKEVEDVNIDILSAAANLKELSLKKSELLAPSVEDNPAVIIPRHLQVSNADFSHLSFGSFDTSSSESFRERPLQSNSEVMKIAEVPSFAHSDGRNFNYNENDHLKSPINDGVGSRGSISAMNCYMPSNSEPEVIRDDARDATHELQYNFPSISDYGTSTSTEHSLLAFAHPQTNSQMQNFAHLSKIMVKPSAFSSTQPTPQSLASTSAPTVPSLPQDLPMHSYSQANLPLGPFTNTISNYTFPPQSYTYLPSAAFPEAFTGTDPLHQSPASVHNTALNFALPQYRSTILTASLPQSAVLASGYGDFGGPTNIPGNFSLNSSTTSTSTSTGFDEDLSSLYKEGTLYLRRLQQNQSTSMQRLPGGGGSRIVSPLPPSTLLQRQNQLGGLQQAQQPSHYGLAGYLNLYQNQLSGSTQEHQQNRIEANLNGSQHNLSKQSHHTWPHDY